MTHEIMLRLAFGSCMLVGGVLGLMGLTAVASQRPGEPADGMLTVTIVMSTLFLYGMAGYLRMLPWT